MNKQQLRREIRATRDDAEDAKALAVQLMRESPSLTPMLRDLALRLDRATGRMTGRCNELVQALRGETDGTQLALKLA